MNILFIVCGFELEIESQMETYAEGFELGVYVIKLAVFVGRVGAGPQFHLACAQDDTVAHAVVFAVVSSAADYHLTESAFLESDGCAAAGFDEEVVLGCAEKVETQAQKHGYRNIVGNIFFVAVSEVVAVAVLFLACHITVGSGYAHNTLGTETDKEFAPLHAVDGSERRSESENLFFVLVGV